MSARNAHRSWRARLAHAWDAVQVELHGCYSVGRLRAFQHYAAHTTHTRTFLVLVLTPLPCLAAVAFADCIPLAPPELGIEHSTGFWLRACFASWVYAYSIMEQLRFFIPELPLTGWITLALSIPVMVLTNAVTFLLALAIGFPLPFTIPMLSIPWATFMIAALWLQLRTFLREHPEKRRPLIQFVCVALCQMSLLVIYPAYNAVFYNLSAGWQVLFALLLPIIKLVEKNCMSLFLDRVKDLKPEQIVFNVEIFNALFIACCMQNSNSIATNFVLVGVDFTMACISLRDLDAILVEVHELASKMHVDPSQLQDTVLALFQRYPQLESQATQKLLLERICLTRTRSRSRSRSQNRSSRVSRVPRPSGVVVPIRYEPPPPNAPPSDAERRRSPWLWLTSLPWRIWPSPNSTPSNPATRTAVGGWVDAKGGQQSLFASVLAFGSGTRNGLATPQGDTEPSSRLRSTIASTIASLGVLKMVFPERALADGTEFSVAPIETRIMLNVELLTEEERLFFLEKTLQTLHLTEYLLLIEYVEVMIPIVYSIYLIVLFHLPNRTFYPQLRDMDEMSLQRTIRNVMMNAIFEFVSLLLLVRVLKRKLHISPLRQLAFVLDRQWRMVQSKVVLWVVVTLQSTLYHLGADYSFKFAWLHQKQSSGAPPSR